jgi:hypothetical protein
MLGVLPLEVPTARDAAGMDPAIEQTSTTRTANVFCILIPLPLGSAPNIISRW